MLLDFLRPHMDVSDNEAFSVYPGKSNNPGDIIKGRTFRRLHVTRKITIKDVPDLIRSALNMQTFALGQKCIRQCRGSPMGSPLSPALCLMAVSISEQIWSINFRQILSNHNLFIRHIRYVDNRLIFGDKRLKDLPPYEVLLDDGFYGKPIILETEPDQEFLGFMLGTKPYLSRSDQCFSSSLAFLGISAQSVVEWLPLPMPHCRQRSIPGVSHPTRSWSINSFVHSCWFSQGGTPRHFQPNHDSASEPSAAWAKPADLTSTAASLLFIFGFLSVCFFGLLCFSLSFLFSFPGLVITDHISFLSSWIVWQLGSKSSFSSLLLGQRDHGPRSRLCISPSSGSGHNASELPHRPPTILWTIHWMGWSNSRSPVSNRTPNPCIKKPPYFCSLTSFVQPTHDGITWRHSFTHGLESWTNFRPLTIASYPREEAGHMPQPEIRYQVEDIPQPRLPPGTSTPLVLTPNPTIRILQPAETTRAPSDPPYRPWTDMDDQELINLKDDTKSRPSWKTIGARLRGIFRYARWDGRSWNKCLTNTVTFSLLTNQRQKIKRQRDHMKRKKNQECLPLHCQTFCLGFSFATFNVCPVVCSLVACHFGTYHSYYYHGLCLLFRLRTNCPRSFPLSGRPHACMWQHRGHSRQRHSRYRDAWQEVPPVRQHRRVLIIVNLEAVRPLITAVHGDTMDSTTCRSLPSLGRMEEDALFTYNVLIHPYHTETLTVNILLYYISQHITYTWDRYLEPSSMDLRWQDSTGDTFVLRNEQTLIELLREHRPHWTEGQEFGILLPNEIRPFTSPNQPYIMRLSCHEALPNTNMLP